MVSVGIDEVGRGCWAGPLVAAAVILATPLIGLKDSKQLNRRQRQRLAAEIQILATAINLGWVTAAEIDELGLTRAVRLAMQKALNGIASEYDEVVIDGSFNFLSDNPKVRPEVRADSSVPAVSAASIVAKVARDNFMIHAAARFPAYGFDKHVGYGTALHLEKLRLHGPCELHRLSYRPLKFLLQ